MLFITSVDIPQFHSQSQQKESEDYEADAGKDYHSSHTCAERIEKHDYREEEKKHSSSDDQSASTQSECLQITSECDDHKAVVQHPEAQDYRYCDQRNAGIHTKEYTKDKVHYSSDYRVSTHRYVVAACDAYDELGGTDKKHQHTEKNR